MEDLDFFYVRPSDVSGIFLTLQKEELHHLVHVHRKKPGERFLASDGKGHVYECQVKARGCEANRFPILNVHHGSNEPKFALTLAVAMPKRDRFEWILEKGTELGVTRFIPMTTERTIVKSSVSKKPRFEKIVLAGMKQCQRAVLPQIDDPTDFSVLCNTSQSFSLKILAHEKSSEHNFEKIFSGRPNRLTHASGILCIGPEGGFTENEIALARRNGFKIVGLGPRRLRTETAALLGATLLLDKFHEFE
ncbi:MAG: RsmE family RNA methyltransferase [bacterium]